MTKQEINKALEKTKLDYSELEDKIWKIFENEYEEYLEAQGGEDYCFRFIVPLKDDSKSVTIFGAYNLADENILRIRVENWVPEL